VGSSVSHCPHIAIIESPGREDVKIGRAEGRALDEALRLAGIERNYYTAANLVEFDDCLARIEGDSHATLVNGTPLFRMLFLHLSMHGNAHGVALTNDQFVSWSDLGDKLLRLASKSDRMWPEQGPACIQTVCMSSCHGVHAVKMAEGKPLSPYYGVIGPVAAVDWSDSLTAFVAFYNATCHPARYAAPGAMVDGVARMNAAIGQQLFHCFAARGT
jgi:hypothetical protein